MEKWKFEHDENLKRILKYKTPIRKKIVYKIIKVKSKQDNLDDLDEEDL